MNSNKRETAEHVELLRNRGLQWKQVGLEVGISDKVARELINWLRRERHHETQWYNGMSPELRRAVLANSIKSKEDLAGRKQKYGDQLRFSLKNFGPKLDRELSEWMTLHITS